MLELTDLDYLNFIIHEEMDEVIRNSLIAQTLCDILGNILEEETNE